MLGHAGLLVPTVIGLKTLNPNKGLRLKGLGFEFGLEFRSWSSGCKDSGLKLAMEGLAFRGLGFKV